MKILAIEASAVAASAAVTDGGVLLAEEFTQTALTHSVTLLPAVDSVMKKSGLSLSEIDLVAVTEGPGSFSGLRIGVTTAKTIAYAAGKKTVGVSTLSALAAALPFAEKVICPIMDARRDQVYNAMFRWRDGKLEALREPRAISAEELANDIRSMGQEVIFIGDGVKRFKEYFVNGLGSLAHFAPAHLCASRASCVAFMAESMAAEAKDPNELNPVYLRLSQAEREYNEKENKGKE